VKQATVTLTYRGDGGAGGVMNVNAMSFPGGGMQGMSQMMQVGVITLGSVNHSSLHFVVLRLCALPYQLGVTTLGSVNHYSRHSLLLRVCAVPYHRDMLWQ
jgi:hypothetical protein